MRDFYSYHEDCRRMLPEIYEGNVVIRLKQAGLRIIICIDSQTCLFYSTVDSGVFYFLRLHSQKHPNAGICTPLASSSRPEIRSVYMPSSSLIHATLSNSLKL